MADNVQVRQNPDKTNAKSQAAAMASFIVGGLAILMTNYGLELDGDLVSWLITGVAIVLIPITTKMASYLRAMDIDDVEVSDDGVNWKKAAGIVANELDEIDHKSGKRKKLKKVGKLLGTAIKFLT